MRISSPPPPEAPKNRRTKRALAAPPDPAPEPSPLPGDVSPLPPRAVSTRPPADKAGAKSKSKARRLPYGKLGRGLSLFAGASVVVASSIGVAWAARRYLLESPRFAIRAVLVEGAERRSAEEVAEAGGVAIGASIFALDLETAKARLEADPWIERAAVSRKLPSRVHVQIVEREARAAVSLGGELYLSTRDGDLFKPVQPGDPGDLPVVTGIEADDAARDRDGVVLKVRGALDLVGELERYGIGKRYPIQEVHIDKDGSLRVTIGKEGIALQFGHGPYRDKIGYAHRILAEVARRKATASVVFLDNDANPERVVVRMR